MTLQQWGVNAVLVLLLLSGTATCAWMLWQRRPWKATPQKPSITFYIPDPTREQNIMVYGDQFDSLKLDGKSHMQIFIDGERLGTVQELKSWRPLQPPQTDPSLAVPQRRDDYFAPAAPSPKS